MLECRCEETPFTLPCLGTQTHHSGYRLPWVAAFDEQPDFHDFHHQRFSCCYGNIGWLDALHGTSRPYREAQARGRCGEIWGGVGRCGEV